MIGLMSFELYLVGMIISFFYIIDLLYLLILFVINPSLITLMIGTPPATAASNSRLTCFFSANFANSSPCLEINALLAVTTCFLFLIELKTNFFAAPSEPPMSSTTISISFFKYASL